MESLRHRYNQDGFVLLKGFFDRDEIQRLRMDARQVFITQMLSLRLLETDHPDEREFEASMAAYFRKDLTGFINGGKICQHLISLHRLSLNPKLIEQLMALGLQRPAICTRPVLYFNAPQLATSEVYYKTPPHQDWRSMQGSLNAMVVWVPLVDIAYELGALEIVPGSHLAGLLPSQQDEWYRKIADVSSYDFRSIEVAAGDALFFSAFLLHRSGDNVTDSIRWSCHFRYNDLNESTFIERQYPNPYSYKPQQELVTENFPAVAQLQQIFRP